MPNEHATNASAAPVNAPGAAAPAPEAPRVLLAAGGTGGHIMPAVALAEALGALAPGVQVQFCCGNRPTELQIYRRLCIVPWVLPVPHHRPGLVEHARFVAQMAAAWRRSRRLLKAAPVQVAVGFGSYISVPPLLAARLAGARLVLHENDVHPGMANRLLAPLARAIATANEMDGKAFPAGRTRAIGNLVRAAFRRPISREEARAFFRLRSEGLVCLCVGGSQGALGMNRIVLELIRRLGDPDCPAGAWQLLWSTGPAHFSAMSAAVAALGAAAGRHGINPFIDEMAMALAAADLVLTRAGALTLAELTAMGRPAVLVPLPGAGGHQLLNARRLAEAGVAEIIEEADPRAAEKLEALLGRLAASPETLRKMGEASRAHDRPEAARQLAETVMELLPVRRQEDFAPNPG